MTEAIKVTIKYEKYTTSAEPTDLESFTLAFMVDPDATYHVILEKIEIMLKSMGYETPSRLDFIMWFNFALSLMTRNNKNGSGCSNS